MENQKVLLEETVPAAIEDEGAKGRRISTIANIASTLLLRIASRTSFVVLGFYLGEHIESAAFVAIILEAFYISELIIAPLVGSLSDRLGRKPFLIAAPFIGAVAALVFLLGAQLVPTPNIEHLDTSMILVLVLILLGRLLEGAATGINAPATLGFITDSTVGSEKLRVRVMTAFEVATVGGLALAIPFAGQVSKWIGTWGFLVVVALHAINVIVIAFFLREQMTRSQTEAHGSLLESLVMLKNRQIFTFLPAWLSINALVGAWITLITIILAYPAPAADLRHPGQLLYGGFDQGFATLMLGIFGLLFLIGMVIWMPLLRRIRRTTTMLVGLGGLTVSIIALTLLNGMGENPNQLAAGTMPVMIGLMVALGIGVVILSGFTPAALTQMSAIADTQPTKRGAVMGLYSVVLAIGQLGGAGVGGLFVDWGGFYGLMIFSVILAVLALWSVWYMRSHKDDLLQAKGH